MRRAVAVGLLALQAGAGFTIAPYLQSLSAGSVTVRWRTAASGPGSVEYGLSGAYGSVVVDSLAATDHEVTLAGLLPDTTYHYRVVAGADTSDDAAFRSVVTGRAFEFLVASDHQDETLAHRLVADRMALTGSPVLLVNCGDLTQNGRTEQYESYFGIERELLARVPVFPAPGNHDVESLPNWHRFFALPGDELHYTVRCGSAAFHAVNVYDSVVPGSSQYQWLLAELLADSADPDVRHVFVYLHLPPYTTNTVYAGSVEVRDHLCPLFERFRVRIVFSGHVHAYEHSLVNGVHYIVTGGGGAALARNWNAAQPWTVYREATHEFLLVQVRGDTVTCRAVRPDGSEFDTLVIAGECVAVADTARAPTQRRAPGSNLVRAGGSIAAPAGGRVFFYDCGGRLAAVRGGDASGRVTTSGLASGIYFLRAAGQTGRILLTE